MRRVRGFDALDEDWRFFSRCYRHTYAEHFSKPYLNLDFFRRIGEPEPSRVELKHSDNKRIHGFGSLMTWDEEQHGRPFVFLESETLKSFGSGQFCVRSNRHAPLGSRSMISPHRVE